MEDPKIPKPLLAASFSALTLRGLGRVSAVCRDWAAVHAEHGPELFDNILQLRRLRPYVSPPRGTGEARTSVEEARFAAALRKRIAQSALGCSTTGSVFESYVRSLAVAYEKDRVVVFAGQYDGNVGVASMPRPKTGSVEPTRGVSHYYGNLQQLHSAQVLAVAVDFESGICVSGSGEPSYHSMPSRRARLVYHMWNPWGTMTKRMWERRQIPPCMASVSMRRSAHSDSINAVLLVGKGREKEIRTQAPPQGRGRPPKDYSDDVKMARFKGVFALSASSDKTIAVTACDTSVVSRVLRGHTGAVWALEQLPCSSSEAKVDTEKDSSDRADRSGSLILSASSDKTVRLWDWRKGTCLATILRYTTPLSALSVSDAGTIAVGTLHGVVRVHDLNLAHVLLEDDNTNDDDPAPLRVWDGEAGAALSEEIADVWHDGDKLVCVCRGGYMELNRIEARAVPASASAPGTEAFTADEIESSDGKYRLDSQWRVAVRMYVSTVSFGPGSRTLVADGFDNRVMAVDFTSDDRDGGGETIFPTR